MAETKRFTGFVNNAGILVATNTHLRSDQEACKSIASFSTHLVAEISPRSIPAKDHIRALLIPIVSTPDDNAWITLNSETRTARSYIPVNRFDLRRNLGIWQAAATGVLAIALGAELKGTPTSYQHIEWFELAQATSARLLKEHFGKSGINVEQAIVEELPEIYPLSSGETLPFQVHEPLTTLQGVIRAVSRWMDKR